MARKNLWLLFLLMSSPCFAQCDSIRIICDSLFVTQQQEILHLQQENIRSVSVIRTMEKFRTEKDSLYSQSIRNGIFQLSEEKKETAKREQFFLIGFVLIFATAILVHIR